MNVSIIKNDKNENVVICQNEKGDIAHFILEAKDLEFFGEDYIKKNSTMEYSKYLKRYYCRLDLEPFYNSPDKSPEKVIHVEFIGKKRGENSGIFKAKNENKYYVRNFIEDQKFAQWFYVGKNYNPGSEYDAGVRSNIVFECDGQTEKNIYRNWNGAAVYSKNYNDYFTELYKNSKKEI